MGRPRIAPEERACVECGAKFLTARYTARRFCGSSCAGKANHRLRRPMGGRDNPNYNGGLCFHKGLGRWFVVGRDGSMTTYARALMMGHLCRDLGTDEVVHHVNGDKTDDRIENLALMSRADHARHHHTRKVEK